MKGGEILANRSAPVNLESQMEGVDPSGRPKGTHQGYSVRILTEMLQMVFCWAQNTP